MIFHRNQPVHIICIDKDTLKDLADITKSPSLEAQKTDLSFIVLQQKDKFKLDLKWYNKKPVLTKIGDTFKTHFQNAQKGIPVTSALAIQWAVRQTELTDRIMNGVQQIIQIIILK